MKEKRTSGGVTLSASLRSWLRSLRNIPLLGVEIFTSDWLYISFASHIVSTGYRSLQKNSHRGFVRSGCWYCFCSGNRLETKILQALLDYSFSALRFWIPTCIVNHFSPLITTHLCGECWQFINDERLSAELHDANHQHVSTNATSPEKLWVWICKSLIVF